MKVIGNYSLRGSIMAHNWDTPIQLMLDYGDMNIAYRVTSLMVSMPGALVSGDDCFAKLATTDEVNATAQSWFWGDNREIAWAQSTVAAAGRRSMNGLPFNGIIDGDNLVVGDLFLIIESDSGTETSVNYKIELEKLKVAPEVTIMTLVNQVDQSD
jgi:hypothetical protein